MPNGVHILRRRICAEELPLSDEIELFGSAGEEEIFRLLREHFDCVLRNVVVPHNDLLLEKDFMVIHQGVPFVLEIKNWKGQIGMEGDRFYQIKVCGEKKLHKSPVGTTNQFLRCLKKAYRLDRPVFGMVVFVEGDCTLNLPSEQDGIAILGAKQAVSYIRSKAKEEKGKHPDVRPEIFLRCTRLYQGDREFCKGVLVDADLSCYNEAGERVLLDTTKLAYVSVDPQPLRLRDKLYVTFINGATGIFYNRDTRLTLQLLDGSFQKYDLCRVRHVVF